MGEINSTIDYSDYNAGIAFGYFPRFGYVNINICSAFFTLVM